MYVYSKIYAGNGRSDELTKVEFGRIVNGNLVYDEGKDDNFVFQGK